MRHQSLLLTLLTAVRGFRLGPPRPVVRSIAAAPGGATEDPAAQLARLAACWAARHGTATTGAAGPPHAAIRIGERAMLT